MNLKDNFIEFKVIAHFDDGSVQMGIRASNSVYSSYEECYIYPDELKTFGKQLKSFPKEISDIVFFKYGEEKEKYNSFILLKSFIYSSNGYSALEVRMNSNRKNEFKGISNFCIRCEVASLNRLGQTLEVWDYNKEEILHFNFPMVS